MRAEESRTGQYFVYIPTTVFVQLLQIYNSLQHEHRVHIYYTHSSIQTYVSPAVVRAYLHSSQYIYRPATPAIVLHMQLPYVNTQVPLHLRLASRYPGQAVRVSCLVQRPIGQLHGISDNCCCSPVCMSVCLFVCPLTNLKCIALDDSHICTRTCSTVLEYVYYTVKLQLSSHTIHTTRTIYTTFVVCPGIVVYCTIQLLLTVYMSTYLLTCFLSQSLGHVPNFLAQSGLLYIEHYSLYIFLVNVVTMYLYIYSDLFIFFHLFLMLYYIQLSSYLPTEIY